MNDIVCDFLSFGKKYTIIAVSVKGDYHNINQDSYLIEAIGMNFCVSVADGLGSAIKSDVGSKAACQTVPDLLLHDNPLANIGEIIAKWKKSLCGNINAYDTTLKFFSLIDGKIRIGKIGDGCVCTLIDGEYEELDNETKFLNHTDSLLSYDPEKSYKEIEHSQCNECTILLATDGFSEDMVSEKRCEFLKECSFDIDTNPQIRPIVHIGQNTIGQRGQSGSIGNTRYN